MGRVSIVSIVSAVLKFLTLLKLLKLLKPCPPFPGPFETFKTFKAFKIIENFRKSVGRHSLEGFLKVSKVFKVLQASEGPGRGWAGFQ